MKILSGLMGITLASVSLLLAQQSGKTPYVIVIFVKGVFYKSKNKCKNKS